MNNNVVEDDGAEATFPMAGFFGVNQMSLI